MALGAGAVGLLLARVLLVGAERVLLRRLGAGRPAGEAAAVFFGVGALVLLPVAAPWANRDWRFLAWAAPAGLVYAAAYWLYVLALAQGEVSRVAPLASLGAVFVVLLAAWRLGEPLTAAKLVGAVLIAAGSAWLQRPEPGAPRPSARAAAAMLAYAALTAATRMLDKAHAARFPAHGALYAWVVFSEVTLAQLALEALRGGLAGPWRLVRARPTMALAAGAANGGSFLLLLACLAAWPVSVAEPATALSLLVTAWLAHRWLGEPIRARLGATAAVVVGTWLLVVGGARG